MKQYVTFSLLLTCAVTLSEIHEVKIVDGADKKPDRGNSDGLSFSDPYSIPTGPQALLILNGLCFSAHADRYEYTICPFQNVTQRRIVGTRATLLGIWGEWSYNQSSSNAITDPMMGGFVYDTMKFSKGHSCGRNDRTAEVIIKCNYHNFSIIPGSIEEVSNCEHSLALGVPLACRLMTENIVVSRENANAVGEDGGHVEDASSVMSEKISISSQQESVTTETVEAISSGPNMPGGRSDVLEELSSGSQKDKDMEILQLKQQIADLKSNVMEALKKIS